MKTAAYDHDAAQFDTCSEEDHAHGCPCMAGGDAIRLSYLRCSECGDFLDTEGRCAMHGLLDPEEHDDRHPDTVDGCPSCEKRAEGAADYWNREGDPAFNGAFDRW